MTATTTSTSFAARLSSIAECLVYQGYRDAKGYGRIGFRGRTWKTHRLAWMFANGPIPSGLQVRHSCDNPPCCNPAHLLLGTNADNMRDMRERGGHMKAACPHGHPFTTDNTRIARGNHQRVCRTCERMRARRDRLRARLGIAS